MFRKTAFQAMDISLNTFIIFVEIYYVLSKLMLCFYVLKNKAILSILSCHTICLLCIFIVFDSYVNLCLYGTIKYFVLYCIVFENMKIVKTNNV